MLTINRLRPRIDAWQVLNQMQEQFNHELSDWFGAATATNNSPLGVWTKEGEAIIAVELPGLEPEDIDVSVHRNVVSISARPRDEELPEGARSLRQELVRDSIERQVQLPFEPENDKVEATYERGLLVLRVSAPESAQPAKIEVKAR